VNGVESVLATRILPFVQAERMAEEWRSKVLEDQIVLDTQLADSGFSVSRNFRFAFNRWRTDHGLKILPVEGTVEYNATQVHDFMVNAMRCLMEATGLHLKGQIGRRQLQEKRIPFSGLADRLRPRFSSQAVFAELREQIIILNELLAKPSQGAT